MSQVTKTEKIFLVMVLLTLLIAIPEYVYMNNHSVNTRKYSELIRSINAGLSEEYINSIKVSYDSETDGLFSPILQLWIIGTTLVMAGLCFSLMLLNQSGLLDIDESNSELCLTAGSLILFWVIAFEVVIFLWKLLT